MARRDIQSSFTSGELSHNLFARIDLDKYAAGASLLRNFFVDFRGGASNRAGTKYIGATTGQVSTDRLIPFIFSEQVAYLLEVGEFYIQAYFLGVPAGAPVTTPYLAADIALLKFVQSADVMTLTHPDYPSANFSRTSTTPTFSYNVITIGSSIGPPTITDVATTDGDVYGYGYVVTAISLDGTEESIQSNPGRDTSVILDENNNKIIRLVWTAPSQAAAYYNIYKWGPIERESPPATVWGLIGSSKTTTFTDNNIAPDFSKVPPEFRDPFSGGQLTSIQVTAGGSAYDGSGGWSAIPYVPLVIAGGGGTGAAGWAVIDKAIGKIVGAWFTSPGKNYSSDPTITANGEGGTGATFSVTRSNITPKYPACATYFQQRRCFAGSTIDPEVINLSQPGNYTNFDQSVVTLASDAIAESMASRELNAIKALVPMSTGLVVFTTGGAFLISGGGQGAALTPTDITSQSQASNGANDMPPILINYDILYVQNKGSIVRDLAFNYYTQSYQGLDRSALANHLFFNFTLKEWAWAEEPFKIVWVVRNDGTLLSLTYVPEQEVYAWARHDTQGQFTSVTSVPEGNVNAVYVIVKRFIPDVFSSDCCSGWGYIIERFDDRKFDCLLDAWFLDCALAYPSTTVASELCLTDYNPLADPPTVVVTLCEPSALFCPAGVAVTGGAGYHTDSLTATNNHFASCSFWHWDDAYDTGGSNHQEIMEVDFEGVDDPNSQLDGDPLNRSMSVNLKGTIGQLSFGSDTAVPLSTGRWNHYIWSGDIATGHCDFLVNGVRNLDTPSFSATGTIPWNGKSLDLFWDPDGNHHFDVKGRIAEYWLAPGQSLLNAGGQITPEVLAKFYNAGCPVFLGDIGAEPTGTAPAVYLSRLHSEAVSVFGTNKGTGGALATQGTPTAVDGPCVCGVAVGDTLKVGCAVLTVTTVNDDGSLQANVTLGSLDSFLIPDADGVDLLPVAAEDWSFNTPTEVITGLGHLEDKVVWALADGLVCGPFTVEAGSITLPRPASVVVVGLRFTSQIKTLYLDIQTGLGTVQSARKMQPAVTLRLDQAIGLSIGQTFDDMTDVIDPESQPTTPPPLINGRDIRTLLPGTWDETGEVCIQQTNPLPATVLGVIAEVVEGDTGS